MNPLPENDTEIVNRILAKDLSIALDQIKPEAHLFRDLGADSLSILEIVMHLEDQFDLNVSDDQFDKVGTVAELYEALAQALHAATQT